MRAIIKGLSFRREITTRLRGLNARFLVLNFSHFVLFHFNILITCMGTEP